MIACKTVITEFINLSFPKMTAQNQLNTNSDIMKKTLISVCTAVATRKHLLEHCRKIMISCVDLSPMTISLEKINYFLICASLLTPSTLIHHATDSV